MGKNHLGTNDYTEFVKWISYMKVNKIDYRASASVFGDVGDYRLTILNQTEKEVEHIKNNIGFYLD